MDVPLEILGSIDWTSTSPTDLGSSLVSVLNPRVIRANGAYHTSVETIHRVIDPLFLDDLASDLGSIESEGPGCGRDSDVAGFLERLRSIVILDPSCGSGNFLVETYLSLRRIEDRALGLLTERRGVPSVDPANFHGIELDPVSAAVARESIRSVSGSDAADIAEGDALLMDWSDALGSGGPAYIVGNPPYCGARSMDGERQKRVLLSISEGVRNAFDLDYACGWFLRAADAMDVRPDVRTAFVSTKSVCQGVQAGNLWSHIVGDLGMEIGFARRPFPWDGAGNANVYCVVVGFGKRGSFPTKTLWDGDVCEDVGNIDCYLLPTADVFVTERTGPVCDVPDMRNGNQPRDGGNLVMTAVERDEALLREPGIERFILPMVGSREFLDGNPRYCLWLDGADGSAIEGSPTLRGRVRATRDFRLSSRAATTRGYARTPHLMAQRTQDPDVGFLLVPTTTSGRRLYLPLGFFDSGTVVGNSANFVPDATLYDFGVLSSFAHGAWIRTVSGRRGDSYRYLVGVTYNCFPWPDPTDSQRTEIEDLSRDVLRVREGHPGSTLARMYDGISPLPDRPTRSDRGKYDLSEFSDLLEAHRRLDVAVESAYGTSFGWDDRVASEFLLRRFSGLQGVRP